MVTVKEYYFDKILDEKAIKLPFISIWEPVGTQVVMGASGLVKNDIKNIGSNNVEIYKRKGGGCAVVLDKGMLVISILAMVKSLFNNIIYFRQINDAVVMALMQSGVQGVEHKGISDLAINNKKILGSSLYRRKYLLYYQGVLLVNPNFEPIHKFLKHPQIEPDYRCGRSHLDFITSLRRENYNIDSAKLCKDLHLYYNQIYF